MKFEKAKPIWIKGQSKTINLQGAFKTRIKRDEGKKYILRVSGATLYRVYINGIFVHYGPARGPHGFARVDEIDLTNQLGKEMNSMAIEVAGYNCPTYYTIKGDSFICAEVLADGEVISYTGRDFSGKRQSDRLQKVRRYAYQRSFMEVWHLDESYKKWQVGEGEEEPIEESIEEVNPGLDFIPREVMYPTFVSQSIEEVIESGRCEVTGQPPVHEIVDTKEETFLQFTHEELEDYSYETLSGLAFIADELVPSNKLKSYQYTLWDMEQNNNGFINFKVNVKRDSKILIVFDEMLENGKIDCRRWATNNILTYELKASMESYDLLSFESYGFKYIACIVLEGEVEVQKVSLVEYSYPAYENTRFKCKDEKIQSIFDAAIQTYRQNTLDAFMDCPTRERAGWLCDSYFTSQSAYLFTGNCEVEKVFLENFVKAKYFTGLPKGMLPMCYPADHFNGNFIPQWGMWYVIELEEYLQRNKKADKMMFKDLCYGLLGYLGGFLNTDGLLEKLQGWNFVEWSVANDWVQDVNYPTNMIYYKILGIIGKLYEDSTLLEQAKQVKKTVIDQSFDGKFFRDHSLREEGKLAIQEDRSEVCQYYAFFTGVADKEESQYTELVDTLLNIFGPARKVKGELPEIGVANAFIGNYLRCIILIGWQKHEQVLEECVGYFYKMAQLTGTLWENDSTVASLNHGFASYIGVVILQALFGFSGIDYDKQEIYIDKVKLPCLEAEVIINTKDGAVQITNHGDQITCKAPNVYQVKQHIV